MQTETDPSKDLDAASRQNIPLIWTFVLRGAIGGILGLFVFLIYLFFADTYRFNQLETIGLLAAGNGALIGALIFWLGRSLGRALAIVLRIVVGIAFSIFSMALVSYVAGGFYEDLKWFLINVFFLAITLGGFAGAFAKRKSGDEFQREDSSDQFSPARAPWTFLWQGAIGGAVGGLPLISYKFLTSADSLSLLTWVVLIATANGIAVGTIIWLTARIFGMRLPMTSRITVGTLFSFFTMGVSIWVQEGINGEMKPLVINVLVVGLMLGIPAGAFAKGTAKPVVGRY